MREKFLPKVGEKLYLHQKTNNSYVNDVRHPYTVRWVSDNAVGIQEAKCIFNGPQYYDSLPDEIVDDYNGRTLTLKWSNAKKWGGAWVHREYPGDEYPLIAEFGRWDYYPYLD